VDKQEKALSEIGYTVCYRVVGIMLTMLGYGLQASKKTLTESPSHEDRDEQFEYINKECKIAAAAGNPVLSKENQGNFKNNGRTYQEEKTPIKVLDHDFPIPALGKATPYGVYDIFKNRGFVSVGISSDTAEFAVESVRKWWYAEGQYDYSNATTIVITADCGGSNGYKTRLWQFELQKLADEIGKSISVMHYPPGTSKWNKIEHRLFSFISKNGQGVPLISTALIGATKTTKGLSVSCVLDESSYEKGTKISDDDFSKINIQRAVFHGEWNYTISPIVS
jgi:hypothetical protein